MTAVIVLLALALLAYSGVKLGIAVKARALLDAGEYTQAKLWFEKNGNEKMMLECDARLNAQIYSQARSLAEAGELDEAKRLFDALGDYQDAPAQSNECSYLKAARLLEQGSLTQAAAILKTMEPDPRTDALMDKTAALMYGEALRLTYACRLEEAVALWEQLGEHPDSEGFLQRCTRLIEMRADIERARLIAPEKQYGVFGNVTVYSCDVGYLVIPEHCDENTRSFIYYPGGWDSMISRDFVTTYLEIPPENTIALFLYTNSVIRDDDIWKKTAAAIDTLEQAALECGVFIREPMVCGSSLGAYSVLHGIVTLYRDFGIRADCALLFDAGNEWDVASLVPTEEDCAQLAETGTELYLFEGLCVGMNKPPIKGMVDAGCPVTIVVCRYDEHEAITADALGMGIMGWALRNRAEPYASDRYTFIALTPDSTYPN